ncbi:MAG: Flp family type IVb pilin [Alphaproteobacteria bacterium]|nr:Flp family type IVb pilin [Alphaproteobacteria bacterium]
MKDFAISLMKDESGASAIEYGLIAGLVSVAIIGALTTMSGSLQNIFTKISDELAAAASGSGGGATTP